MATVERSILIGFSAKQMFELVEDIEAYPRFLPWCERTQVDYRDDRKTIATLHINYLGVRSHFTTENEKDAPEFMRLKLVDGPFRRLEGNWRFRILDDQACKIEFQLNYEFSSKLLDKVIGPVFGQTAILLSMLLPSRLIRFMERQMSEAIDVEVVYALPCQQEIFPLELPEGASVRDAIQRSGVLEKYPEIDLTKNKLGIFAKLVKPETILRHRDRVEIYRPLIADPKEVRKQRAAEGKVMKKGAGDAGGE